MKTVKEIYDNKLYRDGLETVIPYMEAKGKTFLVTGASGLIGSCMVDALLLANDLFGYQNKVYALGRSKEKLQNRFSKRDDLVFLAQDVAAPFDEGLGFDFIIHAASNADPHSYAVYPVETILTNVAGAKNILEYCAKHKETRMLFTSTFEVYGKTEGAVYYSEDDHGVINYNEIRSGYPESKRVCELMVRSYHSEYGVDAVIGRLCSIYGPCMNPGDNKAHAQFLNKGIQKESIVLKSPGLQKRTYCYVIDAVSGLMCLLFRGVSGEAYNVANKESEVTIKDVANEVAKICGVEVIFDLPSEEEQRGFSKPQDIVLKTDKLEALGWEAKYSLNRGFSDTVNILQKREK